MGFRCLFKGHDWPRWKWWHHNAPRIVFASLEYLNDTTVIRTCQRCGKYERSKAHIVGRSEIEGPR